ncbi:MAG: Cof-type HAD-IIB family hydrolase [Senegalia sp. (in: firmicutes)]|uniref:Cof-type HAD-IIB family hydrolase n=1 Tax=Senegalia sp. (in: firmicutes) TaxID=1924098 RepID=UPI003F9CAA58
MQYKAIISDLDGTLLNEEHKISDYTKRTIKKVIDKGVKFFIATGRHHEDIDFVRNGLNLDSIFITSNGCRIHDGSKNKLIGHDIDEDIIKGLINLDIDEDIHKNIYMENEWYIEKENDYLDDFVKDSPFIYEIIDFKELKSIKSPKVFFLALEHEKLVDLKEKIEKLYPGQLNITFSLETCLEVMPKGISKGYAIKEVLKKHDIKLEETIAFGDGLNDLEMLKTVGKGFIMGNAHDKLIKELPNNDIISTNTQEGLAKKLEEIFL